MVVLTVHQITISASQISTFKDCQRKWGFDKLDGIPRQDTDATNEGKAIHKEVEDYYREGKQPSRPEAVALLTHLPKRSKNTHPEVSFEFVWPGVEALAHGFIDLEDDDTNTVYDHKTVADLTRSEKTVEQLQEDPQTILYSVSKWLRSHEVPTCQWTYVKREQPKTRPPKTSPVIHQMTEQQLIDGLNALKPVAEQIVQIRRKGGAAADLPANPASCFKYGACQYKDLCADYAGRGKASSQPKEKRVALTPEQRRALAQASQASYEPPAESAPAQPTDEIKKDPSLYTPGKMPLLETLKEHFDVKPAVIPPDAQPNVTPTDPPVPPQPEVKSKATRGRKPQAPKTSPAPQLSLVATDPTKVVSPAPDFLVEDEDKIEVFDLERFVLDILQDAQVAAANIEVRLEAARIATDLLSLKKGG